MPANRYLGPPMMLASLKGGPDRQGLGGDGGRSGPCAFLGGKVAGPCVMLAPKFAAKRAAPILFKSSSPATMCSKGCGHIERESMAPERHISQTTVSAAGWRPRISDD